MGFMIKISQEEIKVQFKELVYGTVEETLNKLLDEEVDRIANAHRYERNQSQQIVYIQIEVWSTHELNTAYPYVFLDGIYLQEELGRSEDGRI